MSAAFPLLPPPGTARPRKVRLRNTTRLRNTAPD